jgi:hypothetical protein
MHFLLHSWKIFTTLASTHEISIGFNNTFISNTLNTKFLGLVITNSLSWMDHITQLIPKLSKACYVLRCIRPFMSQDALKSIYYSYFHSLITYGIIFWGNPSHNSHIFWLQKKAVWIIMGSRPKDSYRELLKHLRILPLQSQYILSLLLLVVDNKNLFYVNSEIHSINTRQNSNLHQPQANLTLYQKGAYYSAIKVFNNLPPNIINLSCEVRRFKLELGKYLHLKSFYTLEEYYNSCKS